MLVELGNHAAHRGVDDRPKVTSIHIPDADADGLGGYTHEPGGITVADFKKHIADAAMYGRPTRLGGHEALLSIANAWPSQSSDKPAWAHITPGETTTPDAAADIEAFLHEFYETDGERKPVDVDDRYWTKYGPPGVGGPTLPALQALFTNDGRTLQAQSMGGGQVGTTGQLTGATATTATNSGASWTTNQWAGYRVYATVSATVMVWANVISNTGTALTVDRWYASATPGGAAGSTPSTTGTYLIADGGSTSAWFVALTTTNITPAATNTSLSGEYTTASGGYIRKIAPYALTSGTSPVTWTLTPVYTGNGSDTYPSTFYAIGVFNSMVVADTTKTQMFQTSMNASATVAASGDQVTVTDTVTGS